MLAERSSPTVAPVASRKDRRGDGRQDVVVLGGGAHSRNATGRATMDPPTPARPGPVDASRPRDRPGAVVRSCRCSARCGPSPSRSRHRTGPTSSRRPRPRRSPGRRGWPSSPATEIRLGDATCSSRPARRTGPVIATVRPPTSVVSGMTTRWPSAANAGLAAVDPMQPAVAVDEVGEHRDAGPVARHGAGVGRVRGGGQRGVERDLEALRVRPGWRPRPSSGRAAVRAARVAGVACPASSGGKVRIRDGRLGIDRDERAAGHDPADIDRLVDRARHARHAVHRGDGRARPPSPVSSGSARRDDAQVATGPIRGLVRLRSRPGGGIRRRERAERGREHQQQRRPRVAQRPARDLLAGQRQHEAAPGLEEALGQLGQPRHDPDREDAPRPAARSPARRPAADRRRARRGRWS